MSQIKVLIADDHEILRFGVASFLSAAEEIDLVGEASSGDECIELFKETDPDVCVLDISMPGKDGIETTRAIREIDPEVKILILSMHIDKRILNKVMEAGINGYLLKDTEKSELLNGIKAINKGHQVFSDPISKLITQVYINGGKELHDDITERELEILSFIVKGHSSKMIAHELDISPRTVDTHRANLMHKLDIPNAAGLVRYALENDLVPDV